MHSRNRCFHVESKTYYEQISFHLLYFPSYKKIVSFMSLPLFHHLSISCSISYPILNHEQNTILPELSIDYFSILFFLLHFIFLPLCRILPQVSIIQYHFLIIPLTLYFKHHHLTYLTSIYMKINSLITAITTSKVR